jgi:hypothetical protein
LTAPATLAAFEPTLARAAAALATCAAFLGAPAASARRLLGGSLRQDDRSADVAFEGQARRPRERCEQGQGGAREKELGDVHEPIVR